MKRNITCALCGIKKDNKKVFIEGRKSNFICEDCISESMELIESRETVNKKYKENKKQHFLTYAIVLLSIIFLFLGYITLKVAYNISVILYRGSYDVDALTNSILGWLLVLLICLAGFLLIIKLWKLKFTAYEINYQKLKLFKYIDYIVFDLSGYLFVKEKIRGIDDKKSKPSTIFLWVIGVYAAMYGIASTRYELSINSIESEKNAFYAQLSSQFYKAALSRAATIQNKKNPVKPDFLKPTSVIQSLLGGEIDNIEINNEIVRTIEMTFNSLNSKMDDDILNNINMDSISLKGVNIKNTTFRDSSFEKSQMNESTLQDVDYFDSKLDGADFSNSIIQSSDFYNSTLKESNFEKSIITYSKFFSSEESNNHSFDSINFNNANMHSVVFRNISANDSIFSNLNKKEVLYLDGVEHRSPHFIKMENVIAQRAIFNNSNLSHSVFIDTDLMGSQFHNSILDHVQFNNIIFKYVDIENSSLKSIVCLKCDFSTLRAIGENDLYKYIDSKNIFQNKNLSNSKFHASKISGLSFKKSDLSSSSFKCSIINTSNFENSNLENSNFDNAYIYNSDFRGAKNLKYKQLANTRLIVNTFFDDELLLKIKDHKKGIFSNDATFPTPKTLDKCIKSESLN